MSFQIFLSLETCKLNFLSEESTVTLKTGRKQLYQVKKEKKGRKELTWDFSGGTVVKNPPANAGDKGSSPGRSHMPRSN